MTEFLYVVTRGWISDLDKKDTTWYYLFVSLDQDKAKEYLEKERQNGDWDGENLYLCKVPLDVQLDFVCWEKYVI